MPQAHKLHQDRLLDMAMERDKHITAFLKNGVQVKGRVRAHDTFTILLETEKNITLVYKHSITSVFPARISAGRK